MLRKWTLGLIAVLFLFLSSQAQIDSLEFKEQIDKANEYLDRNVDSAFYIAKRLEKEKLLPDQELRVLNIVGNCLQRKGKLDSAMLYYQRVESIAKEVKDDKGMAIVLNNIGIIHTNKGEYDLALKSYLEAIEYERIVKDSVGLAEGLNNVGVVHYYMGDMENTLKYLKQSAEITKAIGDKRVLKKAYINIGAIHRYNQEYEEAIEYYKLGLKISKELEERSDAIVCIHNLADVYALQGRYDIAEEYYREAMDFHQKFENPRGIALEYNNLASMYKQQGKLRKAKEYFQFSIEIADEKKFFNVSESAHAGLADIYAQEGNYKEALKATQELQKRRDSVYSIEKAKNMDELRTKYETAENEKMLAIEKSRADSLKTENALIEERKAKAELKAANRNQWIVGLIGALLISILVFWGLIQRQRRQAQADRDAAIITERDRGIEAVFQAQENERKRISKDLHDGIGQQLSALKMAFQKVRPKLDEEKGLKEDLNKLGLILNHAATDVRTISHQMMPRTLTELGLVEAVEDLLDKTLEPTGIQYQFEKFGMDDRINHKLEIALYRIIQELLNNTMKHSKADQVILQMIKRNDKLIVILEDNGIGIKGEESEGHGLMNIKSRLNPIHGEFNIEAGPTKGTVATIRLDLS